MRLPTVTEILRYFSGYDSVPKQVLEKSCHRGRSVHATCEQIAKGHWIPDSMIKEGCLGYVNSFKQWVELFVDEFVYIEKKLSHEQLLYGGEIDYVICDLLEHKKYLVDIKTTYLPLKYHNVQISAYNELLKQNNIETEGNLLVYLDKDGEFPEIISLEDVSKEFQIFKHALACHNYFRSND